jgi:hypothetical protein
MAKQRITQHKRFVPYDTHTNFCFAKTSFMLKTLYAIGRLKKEEKFNKMSLAKLNVKKRKKHD